MCKCKIQYFIWQVCDSIAKCGNNNCRWLYERIQRHQKLKSLAENWWVIIIFSHWPAYYIKGLESGWMQYLTKMTTVVIRHGHTSPITPFSREENMRWIQFMTTNRTAVKRRSLESTSTLLDDLYPTKFIIKYMVYGSHSKGFLVTHFSDCGLKQKTWPAWQGIQMQRWHQREKLWELKLDIWSCNEKLCNSLRLMGLEQSFYWHPWALT